MLYRRFLKRYFDVAVSGAVLVSAAPVLGVVAAALWLCNRLYCGKGQVFFLQERPGLGGRPFFIYKFKTMTDARGEDGELLPDGLRITPVGKFVRRFSLDEILQVLNVLKGDMSLIGPRPLLTEYLEHYSPVQRRRHEVRPGITGLAQVKGRNLLSWERRFRYDVFYVDNVSARLDLYVLLETVKTVVKAGDTEFPDMLEDTRFKGSRRRTVGAEPLESASRDSAARLPTAAP